MKLAVEVAMVAFLLFGSAWFWQELGIRGREETRRDQWQTAVVEKCNPPQLRRPDARRP